MFFQIENLLRNCQYSRLSEIFEIHGCPERITIDLIISLRSHVLSKITTIDFSLRQYFITDSVYLVRCEIVSE